MSRQEIKISEVITEKLEINSSKSILFDYTKEDGEIKTPIVFRTSCGIRGEFDLSNNNILLRGLDCNSPDTIPLLEVAIQNCKEIAGINNHKDEEE